MGMLPEADESEAPEGTGGWLNEADGPEEAEGKTGWLDEVDGNEEPEGKGCCLDNGWPEADGKPGNMGGIGVGGAYVGREGEDENGNAACSNARAKALTLPKRCFGSFARAVITTSCTAGGIAASLSDKAGGETNMCWLASSLNVPEKGRFPLSH